MAVRTVLVRRCKSFWPCDLTCGLASVNLDESNMSEHLSSLNLSHDPTATLALPVNLTRPIKILDKWCSPFYLPRPQPDLFPQIPDAWDNRATAGEGPSAAEIAASTTAQQAFQVCKQRSLYLQDLWSTGSMGRLVQHGDYGTRSRWVDLRRPR